MIILKSIPGTKAHLQQLRQDGKTIGFVPTMGALHKGHISLIRRANLENDIVVCSIFVNPIQFNNKKDLEKYPRTLDDDIKMLEEVECDVLFAPDVDEMYPEPVFDKYDFGNLDKVMEGKHRPGHFNGVAVVVRKLFDVVEPQKAYFGMKDFQQLRIIQAMVEKLNIPVNIIPCPTLREKDGLAMSSRNVRLTKSERKLAPAIYQVLRGVKEKIGVITPVEAEIWAANQLNKYDEMEVEYFSIVSTDDLLQVESWDENTGVVACTAVNLGSVRLIDNLILI